MVAGILNLESGIGDRWMDWFLDAVPLMGLKFGFCAATTATQTWSVWLDIYDIIVKRVRSLSLTCTCVVVVFMWAHRPLQVFTPFLGCLRV